MSFSMRLTVKTKSSAWCEITFAVVCLFNFFDMISYSPKMLIGERHVNLIFFFVEAELKTFVKSTNGIDWIFSVRFFPCYCLLIFKRFLYSSFGFYWFKVAVFYKVIYPVFKMNILLSCWPYLNKISFFFNLIFYDPSTIYLNLSFLKRLKQLNV